MPIGADTPEEIAVSAMGEIIAVRRGASVASGWTPPARKGARTPEAKGSPAATPVADTRPAPASGQDIRIPEEKTP
jgi:hypothetical protein